jgi:hypothetical protein
LDLVALVTVSGAGALMLRRLVATGAIDLVVVVLGTLAVTALLLVLAAGWAQVAGGRCDPVRGHRLQSSVLWGGLGLTVSLLGAFTAFVTGASPASLRSVESVQAAGSGTWVAVQGPARWRGGYQPSFLVDTGSGRYLRLPGLGPWWLPVSLSQDGRRAVWLDADAYLDRPFAEVVTLDLTVPRSAPRPTAIFVDLQAFAWSALSPDGARLAVVADRQVTVYDLEDGRQVATALLDSPASSPRLAFVDPDRLRVELWRELEPRSDRGRGELIVGALHLDDGRFEITARLEVDLVRGWFRPVSLDTQRMVLYHRAGSGADLVLHDSWSGAPLATLLSSYREGPPRVLFLADGRIAVDASEAGTARLKVFDRDGRDLADRDLGPGQWVTPLSEVAPGRVLATVGSKATSDPAWRRARQGVVVDLESGAQHPLPSGWLPARGQHWPWWIPQKPQAGSLASRLLLNPEGGLEALDPETFDTRHLLGPR